MCQLGWKALFAGLLFGEASLPCVATLDSLHSSGATSFLDGYLVLEKPLNCDILMDGLLFDILEINSINIFSKQIVIVFKFYLSKFLNGMCVLINYNNYEFYEFLLNQFLNLC